MISFKEAQNIISEQVKYIERKTEKVKLSEVLNRVLAEDLLVTENIPSFNNSAMDGYAINTKNKCIEFDVDQTVAAGDDISTINKEFKCVEIMTGAPIPTQFNAVVRSEDVIALKDESNKVKKIKIKTPIHSGENVRFQGEDFKKGTVLFKKNHQFKLQDLMALAALGINEIGVYKKLKVALLSTGSEVVTADTKNLTKGKIRNSTSCYLIETLKKMGVDVEYWGNVVDNEASFLKTVESIAEGNFDIIISTGAVSVGKFDFVTKIIKDLKSEIYFHKVAIRPGKPILFSKININNKNLFFFGLPGNPMASVIGVHFFIEPFINEYSYKFLTNFKFKLENSFTKPFGFTTFYKSKVNLENGTVRILDGQASFMISSFLNANAFVVLEPENEIVENGIKVETYLLGGHYV
ncbi:MAG: molybdopterin molybdotransferase MoeA [Bacteriovoracaceae bacterium]